MTPTARTLAALRRAGFIACTVEKWIAQRGIRMDCFGFADILAARPVDRRIGLMQATIAANASARVAKIKSKPEASGWLKAGGGNRSVGMEQTWEPLARQDRGPGRRGHAGRRRREARAQAARRVATGDAVLKEPPLPTPYNHSV